MQKQTVAKKNYLDGYYSEYTLRSVAGLYERIRPKICWKLYSIKQIYVTIMNLTNVYF